MGEMATTMATANTTMRTDDGLNLNDESIKNNNNEWKVVNGKEQRNNERATANERAAVNERAAANERAAG